MSNGRAIPLANIEASLIDAGQARLTATAGGNSASPNPTWTNLVCRKGYGDGFKFKPSGGGAPRYIKSVRSCICV